MTVSQAMPSIFHSIKRHIGPWMLLLAYAGVITWLSCHHEVWRDEMRALSLVKDCRSPLDIFQFVSKEGHPALWYLMLYAGHALLKTNLILKFTTLAVAIAAAAVFIWKAPFNWLQKALFLAGLFPIYEYSVMSRNYGISLLLLFCFCALYTDRFKHLIWTSVVVFLLAQTNMHSLVIAVCIFESLLLEYGYRRYQGSLKIENWAPAALAFGIMALGIVLAAFQIYPDHSSLVANPHQVLNSSRLLHAVWRVFLHPGRYFIMAFGIPSSALLSILLWVLFLYFARKPFILIVLLGGVMGIGTIFAAIYPGSLRHQGFAYLLVLAAFWMEQANRRSRTWATWPERFFFAKDRRSPSLPYDPIPVLKQGLLFLLLALQVWAAYIPVRNDLRFAYSSSAAFAKLVHSRPEYREAIIIGEPDYYLESLPYYLDNSIYFPREHRFGKTVNFTTANQEKLSLAQLLETGRQLKRQYGKPVLIELGHHVAANAKWFKFRFSFNKYFEYSPESLADFEQGTVKIGEFRRAISDERYAVYEIK